MDEDTLNALLVDSALDALPPDTEALLAAYVAQNPGAAAVREQTHDAVELARTVLKENASPALPEFRAPRTVRQRKLRRYTFQLAGMAATLVIGLSVGSYMMRTPESPQTPSAGLAEEAVPAREPEDGMWSVSPRLLRRKASRPVRWEFYSPVHLPQRTEPKDLT